MTVRGFCTLFFGVVLMVTALSVASSAAFVLGCAALIAWVLALISVLFALFSCTIEQQTGGENGLSRAVRGETLPYTIRVRMITPLPVAPLSLRVALPSGKTSEFLLPTRLFGATFSDNAFPCPHVGVFPVGVTEIAFTDCFGLFTLRHSVKAPPLTASVLPAPRETAPLSYSPGEGETGAMQRAHADRSTPEDTRAWQDGDEMKRVHWKLSMRRQQLMVHTYETPQRPDALVLLDVSDPGGSAAARAKIVDALTETCAGVMKSLLDARRIARLPLTGDAARELSGQTPEALEAILLALAQERFTCQTDFARELMLASRRMRRTGSTAIITSRLTPKIADMAIALGQMGPHTRFMLVAADPLDDMQQRLLHLLERSGVETAHISL